MDFQTALGLLAILVGFVGYALYIRDIQRGRAQPHVGTWLAWFLLIGTASVIQGLKHAGYVTWVTGAAAVMCLVIAGWSWKRGHRKIDWIDWVCLVGSLVGIAISAITANPLPAIIIGISADGLAYTLTYRKAYRDPWSETYGVYLLTALKYVIALFTLESTATVVWLYPAYVIASNSAFMALMLVRRRQIVRHLYR